MSDAAQIYGLVLAGGKSRRMGTDKALLSKDGKSQLQRAVELLQRHTKEVFVSARADQAGDNERRQHSLIIDRYADMGPIAGVMSAQDERPDVAWLVLACDLPNVDDATVGELVAEYEKDWSTGHAAQSVRPFVAYASTHDGLPEPLCAIFAPGSRTLIDAFVADGMVCPRKMLIRSDTLLLQQARADSLDNMNTPEDLQGTGVRIAS